LLSTYFFIIFSTSFTLSFRNSSLACSDDPNLSLIVYRRAFAIMSMELELLNYGLLLLVKDPLLAYAIFGLSLVQYLMGIAANITVISNRWLHYISME